jgi:hypothetical protein
VVELPILTDTSPATRVRLLQSTLLGQDADKTPLGISSLELCRDAEGTPPTVSCTSLRKNSQRPAPAEISTSHRDGLAGTLGYFCSSTDPDDTKDDVYLLSNNHIYANWNTAKAGDLIFQPAAGDGGVAKDTLAVFARCEPLRFGGPLNRVDAAIGKLKAGWGTAQRYALSERVAAIGTVHQDQIAVKHGRSSGYTEGSITDELIDTTVIVPGKGSRFARFENQMRIEPAKGFSKIAKEGDSEAWWWTVTGKTLSDCFSPPLRTALTPMPTTLRTSFPRCASN